MARRKSKTRYRKKRSSKFRNRVRILGFALISVVVSSLVLIGLSLYKFINAPFSIASDIDYTDTRRVWNNNRTNLMLILVKDKNDPFTEITNLQIISFDVPTNTYSIYTIPVDTNIDYALNYGEGPFRRIYSVGNSDQSRGLYLLNKTILKIFAIPIHGYLLMDEVGLADLHNLIGEIDKQDLSTVLRIRNFPKIPKLISLIRTESLTNLKMMDIWDVAGFVKGTSMTSSFNKTLNQYHLLDSANWDELWQSRVDMSNVKREGIKVFVANGSRDPRVPGLAKWGGRVVKNLGADVLAVQNSFVDFDESVIITDDLDLVTVKMISETLNIDKIMLLSDIDENLGYNPHIFRTKVSLILTTR